ncbi:aspartate aminotransferase family protein [Tumebacillus algifaecis]|uniref:Acetylornithine aminotransferase n=2 Tax=Tumebacillus algifaecis TaxID=1214604 RepID=A0A223D705_9BACL|nr:aspartate aminotransferase family protein [Tumebacillus algifaecis]
MNTYSRLPVAFVKGEGCRLWDEQGCEYIDFTSGIAVTNLGHAHPKVTAALHEQAGMLLHTSNLYQIPLQEQVAAKLAELSGLPKAFFCNSGAEANEAAIKLARKYSQLRFGPHKHEILTLHDSFHGRTLATVTATCKPKFQEGFAPLMPGFAYVQKDLAAIEQAIGEATCAVLVEPVQGEGGVLPLGAEFLQGLRELCDAKGILLIFDEVQTGIGRTGKMFGFQTYGVLPDIVTLAKGLGNGVPVGAMLAKEEVAAAFTPGSHGSTFGGNPLAMAAAQAVLEAIEEEDLLSNAVQMGEELNGRLQRLADDYSFLLEARGQGLLQGLVLDRPVAPLVSKCLEYGLLVLSAGEHTLRLLPPLNVTSADLHLAIKMLEKAVAEEATSA